MKVKLSSNLFILSTTFRVLVLVGFLANVPTLLASNSKIVLKLQTKLGVETTVALSNISTDDYILDYLVNAWDDKKLLLSIAEDVYIGIPIEIFQQAELIGNLHVVTFNNQSQVKGRLVCTIIGEDNKEYDLRTADKIVTVSTPKKSETISEVKPIIPWQLHLNKPLDKMYKVFNPRFALRYYSSAGYMMGGSYRETQTTTFYIKIKEEEVVANLMDFKEVSLKKLKKEYEVDTKIIITSPSGVTTDGMLIFKVKDSAGYHKGFPYYLVANCVDFGGGILIIGKPYCTIRQISE